MEKIPLFPLHLVMFPGSRLPLRIFEPRYTDLVSECLQSESGFGICLINEGSEVGGDAQCHLTGCYVEIVDWSQLEDGLLGITVEGKRRFQITSFSKRKNMLLEGEVTWLDDDDVSVGREYSLLQEILLRIFEHFKISYDASTNKLENASWLGYRLAEYLPVPNSEKQSLLELAASPERLDRIQDLLQKSEAGVE